jgi:hypothetical protein
MKLGFGLDLKIPIFKLRWLFAAGLSLSKFAVTTELAWLLEKKTIKK